MAENNKKYRTILLSGGGTGGATTPLLSVAEELKRSNKKFNLKLVFVGNNFGPEKEMVAAFNKRVGFMEFIPFISGKWRRYFSLQNFWDIFKIIIAYFKSFSLLRRVKPDLIISVGGFVSVPLVWAAAGKKIPILIHQQDFRPGLANKLMAPFAWVITVTFEKSLGDYGSKAIWIGNPVKLSKFNNSELEIATIKNKYNLSPVWPLVVIVGGGNGARAINDLIFSGLKELTKFCQLLQLTGIGKLPTEIKSSQHYQVLEILPSEDFLELINVAEVVVSRCGLATLSELSVLNKAAILIPLPNSHQEDNARFFARQQAAIVLTQKTLTSEKLSREIKRLLDDQPLREKLKNNIGKVIKRGAVEKLVGIIGEIIEK